MIIALRDVATLCFVRKGRVVLSVATPVETVRAGQSTVVGGACVGFL